MVFVITVEPKLGQDVRQAREEIEGVLADLKDYRISVDRLSVGHEALHHAPADSVYHQIDVRAAAAPQYEMFGVYRIVPTRCGRQVQAISAMYTEPHVTCPECRANPDDYFVKLRTGAAGE